MTSSNDPLDLKILHITRGFFKTNKVVHISNLTNRHETHGQLRNKRNIGNWKFWKRTLMSEQGVPSVVHTEAPSFIGWHDTSWEWSEVTWKEAPESSTQGWVTREVEWEAADTEALIAGCCGSLITLAGGLLVGWWRWCCWTGNFLRYSANNSVWRAKQPSVG
jgi:hypothetical protein